MNLTFHLDSFYVRFTPQELPRIIDAEVLSSQPEPEGHGFVWKGKEIRLDHMVPWLVEDGRNI